MKDIIIFVAFIALGIFVSGAIDDFKAPITSNVNWATTVMNENVPTTKP